MKHTYLYIAVLTAALAASCTREYLVPRCALAGKRIVEAEEGQFPVSVSTSGVWYAVSQDGWIEVDSALHSGDGSFSVRYASNESIEGAVRFCRIGRVLVKTHDGASVDTLEVWQRGKAPVIIPPSTFAIGMEAGVYCIPVVTNLGDAQRSGMSFSCDAPWISDVRWADDNKYISFSALKGEGVSAKVNMNFRDAWGGITSAECTVVRTTEMTRP